MKTQIKPAPAERIVIVLEGRMGSGKTTIATLIACQCTNPHEVASLLSPWHVVDLRHNATPQVRALAELPKLIVCCEEINAKKFHHWWTAILANAQVFYWRIERQNLVLNKPSTITFKNKHI